MATGVKLSVSINRLYPGQKLVPGDKRWDRFNGDFNTEEHTPESLFEEVAKNGNAFCCALKGYRKTENFVSAQTLGLDFDKGAVSLEALLGDSFIVTYASFIYSTLSHTPEHPRWRVVFVLTEAIANAETYRKAQTAFLAKYGTTDQSIKDPARLLFGSNPTNGVWHYLGNLLPMAEVLELVSEYEDKRRVLEREIGRRQLPAIDSSRIRGSTPDERYVGRAIEEESNWLASRVKGTGDRHSGLIVVAARLESLRLSEWLTPESRATINPYEVALEAAISNGYVAEYGEEDACRAIAWGIGVAEPRPIPSDWGRQHGDGGREGQVGPSVGVGSDSMPQSLLFRTAREVSVLTPERPNWIVDKLIAEGAITELDAKVKVGKTTFILAMVAALLQGEEFLEFSTQSTPIVYLTEERPPSFRAVLDRVGLTDEEKLHIVFKSEVRNLEWPIVVSLAVRRAKEVGAGLLVVDTLARWAGLKDDSENNSGAAMEAMAPLEEAAAQGLAVLISRHDRKSGGEIGDSGRGSSAFSGISDIIITLRRADTKGHPSRRQITGVGRFDGIPESLVVEWKDGKYLALGDRIDVERIEAREKLLAGLPGSDDAPGPILDKLVESTGCKRATLGRALKELEEEGLIKRHPDAGKTKRGFGYTLAEKRESTYREDPGMFPFDHVPHEDVPKAESRVRTPGHKPLESSVSSPQSFTGYTIYPNGEEKEWTG
ncbi:MAG: AAA family ATPase [Chloroflexi bacterium]|nr:AAA family ATPase [Chloroflexota bacterium]